MINETTLSPSLRHELAIVTATGLYNDPGLFLADAVRTFLAARPDLREAMACTMYRVARSPWAAPPNGAA